MIVHNPTRRGWITLDPDLLDDAVLTTRADSQGDAMEIAFWILVFWWAGGRLYSDGAPSNWLRTWLISCRAGRVVKAEAERAP